MLFRMLPCLLPFLATVSIVHGVGDLGIPGTTSTLSGYDTELGGDPICWRGRAALNDTLEEATTTAFPNQLVEDFVLLGNTELSLACPNGTSLNGYVPSEFGTPPHYDDGVRPRTGEWYKYRVTGTIDLTHLDGNALVSDTGTERSAVISVQILMCELGQSGFCSPFIHEQANARLFSNNITSKIARGDRHGGTHVHSPYVFVNLSSTEPLQSFDVEVPLLINDPGDFFGIAAVNLFTSDAAGGPALFRHDIGNALDMKLVSYQDQATILQVSTGAKIFSWVCLGIACCIILWLLINTVKHRANRVITLSQGRFLIIFLLAALVASASVFLLDPKNDLYCSLSAPMILIPLQLLYGVTIARIWRINIVISPLLSTRMEPRKGCTNRFVHCVGSMTSVPCTGNNSKSSTRNLRKSVDDTRLALVVALFTLPQAVLQALSLALQPNQQVIDFNQDESTGRARCQAFSRSNGEGLGTWESLKTYGMLLLAVTLIMLMIVATQSRNLPSLFNETRSMYDSTLISIFILLLGVIILAMTDDPTTSPNVEYIVGVAVVLCITLNTSLRIMLPKLRLVWRGETVVVSQLVSDYKAKKQKRTSTNISGFDPKGEIELSEVISRPLTDQSRDEPRTTVISDTVDDVGESTPFAHDAAKEEDTDEEDPRRPAAMKSTKEIAHDAVMEEDNDEEGPHRLAAMKSTKKIAHDAAKEEDTDEKVPHRRAVMKSAKKMLSEGLFSSLPSPLSGWKSARPNRTNNDGAATTPNPWQEQNRSRRNVETSCLASMVEQGPIVVTDDETPTRRLVLPMFELQHRLDQVTKRITSGSRVPHEEWVSLKDACEQMGATFQDDVQFEWNMEEEEAA